MTESIKSAERTGRHLTDCDGKSGHIIENVDIKLAGIYHPFSSVYQSILFLLVPNQFVSMINTVFPNEGLLHFTKSQGIIHNQ